MYGRLTVTHQITNKTIPNLHVTVKEFFYLALRKFRSTYATRMLRAGFDVHAVQHRMGHKSLETTMRHLSPAKDVHERLDKVKIAGILEGI